MCRRKGQQRHPRRNSAEGSGGPPLVEPAPPAFSQPASAWKSFFHELIRAMALQPGASAVRRAFPERIDRSGCRAAHVCLPDSYTTDLLHRLEGTPFSSEAQCGLDRYLSTDSLALRDSVSRRFDLRRASDTEPAFLFCESAAHCVHITAWSPPWSPHAVPVAAGDSYSTHVTSSLHAYRARAAFPVIGQTPLALSSS